LGCDNIATPSSVSLRHTFWARWSREANFPPVENEIVGEALVALKHDELKEMGIASVGHRLTILKSVYEIKVNQGIPVESDHYIPQCESATFLGTMAKRLIFTQLLRKTHRRNLPQKTTFKN
jgi:hypothetical protein